MCGRYSLASSGQLEFRTRFGLRESVEIKQRFNVCPGDDVPAVVAGGAGAEFRELRWGLVPPWADDPATGYKMINARSETVFEKAAYREPIAHTRCIILADGFYEWEKRGTGKQPWHITLPGSEPFAFAGLWTSWSARDTSQRLDTCSILTRPAQPGLTAIHPRQPVILGGPEEEALWIDPETPLDAVRELSVCAPPAELQPRAVGPAVSNTRNDGAECLLDAEPDPQQPLW